MSRQWQSNSEEVLEEGSQLQYAEEGGACEADEAGAYEEVLEEGSTEEGGACEADEGGAHEEVLEEGSHPQYKGGDERPIAQDKYTEYWPDWYNEASAGKISFELPDTIFTAVMVYRLNKGPGFNPLEQGWTFLCMSYLAVLVLQVGLAVTLHEAVVQVQADLTKDCQSTSTFAQTLSFAAFALYILRDLCETYDMWQYLLFFDIGDETGAFKVARFRDNDNHLVNAGDPEPKADEYFTGELLSYRDNYARIFRPISALSSGVRDLLTLFVLVPKAVVSVLVLIAGSGAILRAENSFDVILNSVAAVFLMEVDDVAYRVLVPNRIKKMAGAAPIFSLSEAEYQESPLHNLRYWFPLLFLVSIAVVQGFLTFGYWCTAAAPGTPFWSR